MNPEKGICRRCGKPIEFNGKIWFHPERVHIASTGYACDDWPYTSFATPARRSAETTKGGSEIIKSCNPDEPELPRQTPNGQWLESS